MHIIVLSKRRGSRRHYDLRQPRVCAAATLSCVAVLAIAFAAGTFLGQHDADPALVTAMAPSLADDANEANEAAAGQERLNALAMRLGQMRAHVIRLDALGKRLTRMAGIDDGEFNFSERPAQGGPETDFQTGSATVEELVEDLETFERQIADRTRQLAVLESLLLDEKLQTQVHPEGSPVSAGFISSYFGKRNDPFTGRVALHKGVDFAGRDGAEVLAVAAGIVTFAGENGGFGKLIEINHGNGYVTRYAHNKRNLVSPGDTVQKGQPVALMGATGRATGPNLHFEVLLNDRPVDPLEYIRASR